MILDTVDRYGGVEKAELRVKRSAKNTTRKKAEKKQEATISSVSRIKIQK